LREAVSENLDTIRGAPPRAIRPHRRLGLIWFRRVLILLVPVTLAASTYMVASAPAGEPLRIVRASLVPPAPPKKDPVIEPGPAVRAAAFPLAVRRVVLDAGHGGRDAGATSENLTEKDITLDIGARLREMLEKNGFEVILTRSEDQTIALKDRAKLANESRSDIFVSIHINTILKHVSSHGVETYYLGPTNDPKLTELAAHENSVSGYSLADLRKLLDGVYADARRDESRQLATIMQRELHTRLSENDPGLENWGVKRAPFVVLVATEMPAILAEVGCLSNRKEAEMLGKPAYRQQIAEALFNGIHAYASANDAPQKKGP
jgi:N-acetylmuramoyl-L-alanine amidase